MKKLFQKAWWYYFFGMLGFSFLVCYPFFLLALSHPDGFDRAHWMRKCLTAAFLKFMGIRIKTSWMRPADLKNPHIICSNHCSDLDILILLAVLPGRYAFLGKQELAELPLFGHFFSRMDIPVNRGNAHQSSLSYRLSLKRLKEGVSLVIFPEGGIYRDFPKLSPFRKGAFELALRTGTPVLPITIRDSWQRLHPYDKWGSPGVTEVFVHEAVEPGDKGLEVLKGEVFDVINQFIRS